MSAFARSLKRQARRAEVRRPAAYAVTYKRDRMTGDVVRAILRGTPVRHPGGGVVVAPSAPSRQTQRGGKFSAWLDVELAERRRSRSGRRRKNRRERRARRLR